MGISGLLPALKPIHKKTHLSEFTGKRVAVDGYVWLHKGVYGCATELALGKPTTKYVDFSMHRINLLRYHGIEPYLVFDGGPLPAKRGTDDDRKKKREEYLARGRVLAAQGKHSQARECFVKAIDVTPEMAYQVIKALKAESVSYIVAPYEADAQLAYLEQQGLVDAILTEDSDLLVFGCRNVWFKLDVKEASVVSISRSDFGCVTATAADPTSISLIGWDDSQFRAMAILSGCDYLPSIPGIGLKTASTLLKKWKTPEQVIRYLSMEGKKSVPVAYPKNYKLAEKCFLHQRVYCPTQERLVHLTPVGDDWNDEFDKYVGGDMDPAMAKKVAVGDCDPLSLKAMKDINPNYRPRGINRRPLVTVSTPVVKAKEKAKGGILSFFGENAIIPPAPKTEPSKMKKSTAGKASGKRTLAEIADQETVQKQKKKHRNSTSPLPSAQSKFFSASTSRALSGVHRRHSDGVVGLRNGSSTAAGPSRIHIDDTDKENDIIYEDDILSESEEDGSRLSLVVQAELQYKSMELDIDEFPDIVEQEDGYISPPSRSGGTQDLSSPPRPGECRRHSSFRKDKSCKGKERQYSDDDDQDFDDIEAVSSPVSTKRRKTPLKRRTGHNFEDYILTPVRRRNQGEASPGASMALMDPTPASPTVQRGPDLFSMLGDEDTEIASIEDDDAVADRRNSSFGLMPTQEPLDSDLPPTPSPDTPVDSDTGGPSTHFMLISGEPVEVTKEEEERIYAYTEQRRVYQETLRKKFMFTPVGGGFGPSGTARERANAFMKNHKQASPRRKQAALPKSPTKTVEFASGSGASRALNLKRNEVNITPQGRHTLLGPVPKSLPLKKKKSMVHLVTPGGRQLGTLLADKPRPSSSSKVVRQVVDLTELDSDEDEAPSNTPSNIRSRFNLDQFRYARCT